MNQLGIAYEYSNKIKIKVKNSIFRKELNSVGRLHIETVAIIYVFISVKHEVVWCSFFLLYVLIESLRD